MITPTPTHSESPTVSGVTHHNPLGTVVGMAAGSSHQGAPPAFAEVMDRLKDGQVATSRQPILNPRFLPHPLPGRQPTMDASVGEVLGNPVVVAEHTLHRSPVGSATLSTPALDANPTALGSEGMASSSTTLGQGEATAGIETQHLASMAAQLTALPAVSPMVSGTETVPEQVGAAGSVLSEEGRALPMTPRTGASPLVSTIGTTTMPSSALPTLPMSSADERSSDGVAATRRHLPVHNLAKGPGRSGVDEFRSASGPSGQTSDTESQPALTTTVTPAIPRPLGNASSSMHHGLETLTMEGVGPGMETTPVPTVRTGPAAPGGMAGASSGPGVGEGSTQMVSGTGIPLTTAPRAMTTTPGVPAMTIPTGNASATQMQGAGFQEGAGLRTDAAPVTTARTGPAVPGGSMAPRAAASGGMAGASSGPGVGEGFTQVGSGTGIPLTTAPRAMATTPGVPAMTIPIGNASATQLQGGGVQEGAGLRTDAAPVTTARTGPAVPGGSMAPRTVAPGEMAGASSGPGVGEGFTQVGSGTGIPLTTAPRAMTTTPGGPAMTISTGNPSSTQLQGAGVQEGAGLRTDAAPVTTARTGPAVPGGSMAPRAAASGGMAVASSGPGVGEGSTQEKSGTGIPLTTAPRAMTTTPGVPAMAIPTGNASATQMQGAEAQEGAGLRTDAVPVTTARTGPAVPGGSMAPRTVALGGMAGASSGPGVGEGFTQVGSGTGIPLTTAPRAMTTMPGVPAMTIPTGNASATQLQGAGVEEGAGLRTDAAPVTTARTGPAVPGGSMAPRAAASGGMAVASSGPGVGEGFTQEKSGTGIPLTTAPRTMTTPPGVPAMAISTGNASATQLQGAGVQEGAGSRTDAAPVTTARTGPAVPGGSMAARTAASGVMAGPSSGPSVGEGSTQERSGTGIRLTTAPRAMTATPGVPAMTIPTGNASATQMQGAGVQEGAGLRTDAVPVTTARTGPAVPGGSMAPRTAAPGGMTGASLGPGIGEGFTQERSGTGIPLTTAPRAMTATPGVPAMTIPTGNASATQMQGAGVQEGAGLRTDAVPVTTARTGPAVPGGSMAPRTVAPGGMTGASLGPGIGEGFTQVGSGTGIPLTTAPRAMATTPGVPAMTIPIGNASATQLQGARVQEGAGLRTDAAPVTTARTGPAVPGGSMAPRAAASAGMQEVSSGSAVGVRFTDLGNRKEMAKGTEAQAIGTKSAATTTPRPTGHATGGPELVSSMARSGPQTLVGEAVLGKDRGSLPSDGLVVGTDPQWLSRSSQGSKDQRSMRTENFVEGRNPARQEVGREGVRPMVSGADTPASTMAARVPAVDTATGQPARADNILAREPALPAPLPRERGGMEGLGPVRVFTEGVGAEGGRPSPSATKPWEAVVAMGDVGRVARPMATPEAGPWRGGLAIPGLTVPMPGGTNGASNESGMKRSPNTRNLAGSVQQKLPGAGSSMPGTDTLVRQEAGKAKGEVWESGLGEELALEVTGAGGGEKGEASVPGVEREGGVRSGRWDSMERLHRLESLLVREVAAIRRLGGQELVVTLRPDGDTELVVHLRQGADQMEAVLRWERGDSAWLGQHLNQLQESLAERRIRLVVLPEGRESVLDAGAGNTGNTARDGSGGRRSEAASQWAREEGAAAAVRTLKGRQSGGSSARSAEPVTPARRDGWESWA